MRFSKIAGGSLAAAVAVTGLSFTAGTAAQAAPNDLPTCTNFSGDGSHKITDVDGDGMASPGDKIALTVTLKNSASFDVNMYTFSTEYVDANGGNAYYTLQGKDGDDVLEAGGTFTMYGESTIQEGDFGKTDPVTLETSGFEVTGPDTGCYFDVPSISFDAKDLGGEEPKPEEPKPEEPKPEEPKPEEPKPEEPKPEKPGPIVDTGYAGNDNTALAGFAGAGLLVAGAAAVGATRVRRNH